jgi:hypothetical protein
MDTTLLERRTEAEADALNAQQEPVVDHAPVIDEERILFERSFDRSAIAVSWRELLAGFAALGGWFVLFAGGILIGTQVYISALGGALSLGLRTWYLMMVVMFWTITNVGLLSCLAAILGAFGRRTKFTSHLATHWADEELSDTTRANPRTVVILYASAIMRGFGVYALVLAGLLVLATDMLVTPSQVEYVRLAATISIISFYAGYDPQMFAGILDRIKRLVESKST